MRQPTRWEQIGQANPDRSVWYIERFRAMAAQGADLAGEARLIDAMVPRGSRILDAGSGPGRVGGELARRGHVVVGVDVDPLLVEAAQAEHPESTWLVGDLAELDLDDRFDIAVMAGNVLTFVAEGTEVEVLRRIGNVLTPEGRLVIGFGAGRGYAFDRLPDDAGAAGLRIDQRFSTWDLRPFGPGSEFLVAVLSRA
ncbi:class I SAM-dependent methyltransferase [Cellulomonas sp. RIT-PI-Y]|uniref:class I SAM-dependent methyltransferase n=1 Tax=Cellulomonas sp. RIT-PI-Y TaxID=3035297 RepID=UPI0021D85DC2|nr:class I SAM-dependent methyltransferase [Cellulomonas sp. RIT-PI-Y]